MASTLNAGITHGSKSRINNASVHTRKYELNHDDNTRDSGRDNNYNLWIGVKQMVWGQHNPYLNIVRRNSGFRFNIQHDNSWFRFLSRNSDKGCQSGTRSNRNRKRNRHLFYYGFLISLLSVAPVRAEDETNNVSNPVAAATGNVTNQAVQFQNNGAPSRQVYGPNISCNGSTMTFSPFYMGNHTTPFDDRMDQQSYTVAENWGFQVNFMVPLDQRGLEQCRRMAKRQEEKMRLDFELVRALKCAELQQKGFMLVPGSRVYNMCSDVIPIASYIKSKQPPQPEKKGWSLNPFKK